MGDSFADGTGSVYSITPDERPSIAVVRAVAQRLGSNPAELPQPLNEVLDPDALDALFTAQPDDRPREGGIVSFEFNGYVVTVKNADTVYVDPID